METIHQDTVVIGAGVVGLAVGRALALAGRDVIVLEAEARPGSITSSRNSEVIHSGIYYPKDSLKARACVRGREMLYAYCAERGIAHRRCGKLIVAARADEEPALEQLHIRAVDNGVTDLSMLDAAASKALEPNVKATAALLCPSTGIIDSHELMTSLAADIEDAGGMVVCNTRVAGIEIEARGLRVLLEGDDGTSLLASRVVNSCGLMAPRLLQRITGFPDTCRVASRFAKGNYFALSAGRPFSRLIYPLPQPGGLGVHATLDLAGAVRFGPDVEWVDDPTEYSVDEKRADAFYDAIRQYFPSLADGALSPAYCGIRPKITDEHGLLPDFMIQGETQHGLKGLVNLLGIESPGLTSCLALADQVKHALVQ